MFISAILLIVSASAARQFAFHSNGCQIQTWVQAPDLRPGSLVHGQAHLVLSGCKNAIGWNLGLRFKERAIVRLSVGGVSPLHSPILRDLFPETSHVNESLWEIHAEERLGFDARLALASPHYDLGLPFISTKNFTLAVPFTNFPLSHDRYFGTYDHFWEYAHSEEVLEYYTQVLFTDGTTQEKIAGWTLFRSLPHPPVTDRQILTIPISLINLSGGYDHRGAPPCDEMGEVKFNLSLTFPKGTQVIKDQYLPFIAAITKSGQSSLRITTITAWIEYFDTETWANTFLRDDQQGETRFVDFPSMNTPKSDVCKIDDRTGKGNYFEVLAREMPTFQLTFRNEGARLRFRFGTEYGCEVDGFPEPLEVIEIDEDLGVTWSTHYCGKPRSKQHWLYLEASVPVTILPSVPPSSMIPNHYLEPIARVPMFVTEEFLPSFLVLDSVAREDLFPLGRNVASRYEEVQKAFFAPRRYHYSSLSGDMYIKETGIPLE